jgi:hypothetical protein
VNIFQLCLWPMHSHRSLRRQSAIQRRVESISPALWAFCHFND